MPTGAATHWSAFPDPASVVFGPLTPLGGRVRTGDIVGSVQVGSIYALVIAPVDGSLDRMLAAPETLVGFGTPLFEIRLAEKAA